MKYLKHISNMLALLVKPYPLRDWYIILGLSFIVFVVLAIMSVNFFIGIRSGSIVPDANIEPKRLPTVSRKTLEDVVSLYETKQVNYDAGNITLPSAVDPF